VKLTESTIAKTVLAPGQAESIIFDDDLPGFGIRLRSGGSRTWLYQFKIGTKHRRITLGKYPALRPAKARETAAKLHAEVKLGNDPAGIKAEKTARAGETFGSIVERYLLARLGTVRPSTHSENTRHLIKNLKRLHGLHIMQVDRRAIALELSRITEECGPIQANRTRASLCKFLDWCAREGLIDTNPATYTNVNPEKPRERVLADQEIRQIWKALPANDFGWILKLLFLTGMRKLEVADLRWSEIDLERGLIVIPASRSKNRRAHVVPITNPVRAILDTLPHRDGRDHIFGADHGSRGFSGWSFSKNQIDAVVKIPAWVIHDVRRSVATGMAEIGILPHIIEAVLNHVSGHKAGVAGVYNRSRYEAEKASALARWGEHVTAIVEKRQSNITTLRA
jgi:integrase